MPESFLKFSDLSLLSNLNNNNIHFTLLLYTFLPRDRNKENVYQAFNSCQHDYIIIHYLWYFVKIINISLNQ